MRRVGGTYGVGCVSDVDSARRREASLMRLSRSLSFGTTCLVTSILSNSFYSSVSATSQCFPQTEEQAYLALLPQLLNHLTLHLPQHALCPFRDGRVASRDVFPSNLAERLAEGARVELLQSRGARAGRHGGVALGQRRRGRLFLGGLVLLRRFGGRGVVWLRIGCHWVVWV